MVPSGCGRARATGGTSPHLQCRRQVAYAIQASSGKRGATKALRHWRTGTGYAIRRSDRVGIGCRTRYPQSRHFAWIDDAAADGARSERRSDRAGCAIAPVW
jgi:hypothetical protein